MNTSPLVIVVILVFLVLFVTVMLSTLSLRRKGKPLSLRPLVGFSRAKGLLGEAAETGRALQIAPGFGGLLNGEGADTLAGLTMINTISRDAALTGAPTIVTSNDSVANLLGANANRDAYIRSGRASDFDSTRIRLLAQHDNVAYAVAALDVEESDQALGNILMGRIGYEYILIGEPTRRRGILQVVGTTQPEALPLIYLTADEMLIGEEVFAAGAYLGGYWSHLGSLRAQDVARIFLIIILLLAFIASAFNRANIFG